jgi:hypothetical protein
VKATRKLADEVVAVTGPALDDDATLLILDWHGAESASRSAALTLRFEGAKD